MSRTVTEIVPLVDEANELRRFAELTDKRKEREANAAYEEAQRCAAVRRSENARRRRLMRSLRKVSYGVLSACFALNAYLAWHSAEPELCVFPAALAALVAWAGITD